MQIVKNTEKDLINQAVTTLNAGGLLVYPTETCYGLGCDATNQAAVDKLFAYKSRREGKPLSIAVTDRDMASRYAEINELAANLYDNYLPGPITVVSKGLGNLAKGVESEFGTIGVRIPAYPLVLEIVKAFGRPITATSANTSYGPKPYSIESLLDNLPQKQKELIDMIIDAGELPHNEPSTVVDTTLNNLNVMRQGSLKFNENLSDEKLLLKADTDTVEQTADFGGLLMLKYIDTPIERPLILALKGELGAGKTQLVKGIAKQLGIKDEVTSPTYTIIDEYRYNQAGRNGYLVHVDTWRVDGEEELVRTGLAGYFKAGNIIAIEWADKFYDWILSEARNSSAKILKVEIANISEGSRSLKVYDEQP